MSSFISLTEAREKLTEAAYMLAPNVHGCLNLWLQAVDNLPQHQAQHPSTAAASQLVEAALRQAPWPMQEFEVKQIAWLQKHLPGLGAAMQECVSQQLEICTRRISILQSIVNAKQGMLDSQLSARLEAERDAFVNVRALVRACLVVMPVNTLCDGLAWSHVSRSHMQHGPGHAQHRLQKGNSLISRIGQGLQHSGMLQEQTQHQLDEMREHLAELGTPMDASIEMLTPDRGVEMCATIAAIVWLRLLAALPSRHEDIMHFLLHIDWHLLINQEEFEPQDAADSFGDDERLIGDEAYVMGKPALCHVFAQPEFFSELQNFMVLPMFGQLFENFRVTEEDLLAAGMSVEHLQQLLPVFRAAVVPEGTLDDPQTCAKCSIQLHKQALTSNSADTCGRDGDRDQGRGTVPVVGAGLVAGDADSPNDMDALLKMMYGCDV